jgi:hypothetical protein
MDTPKSLAEHLSARIRLAGTSEMVTISIEMARKIREELYRLDNLEK